jgi:hypothetical protein
MITEAHLPRVTARAREGESPRIGGCSCFGDETTASSESAPVHESSNGGGGGAVREVKIARAKSCKTHPQCTQNALNNVNIAYFGVLKASAKVWTSASSRAKFSFLAPTSTQTKI